MDEAPVIDPTYCGPVAIKCEGWPVSKMFVIWDIASAGSVRAAVHNAALEYKTIFARMPQYAFMLHLPRSVEGGVEIEGLMLFEAEWMVSKCVVVGWHYK